MKKFILTLLALPMVAAAKTDIKDLHMFFYCTGHNGDQAIVFAPDSYKEGLIKGVTIQRRGLWDDMFDEKLQDKKMEVKASPNYKPREPKHEGMQQYKIATENTEYVFVLPTRADLEPIWNDVGDGGNTRFEAYLQMRYNNGDDFANIRFNCTMNWKPSQD